MHPSFTEYFLAGYIIFGTLQCKFIFFPVYSSGFFDIFIKIPALQILGEGGMHIFIKLKGINSRQLLEKCCRKNVIFTPGDIFYVDDKGQDTLRLGFSRVSKEDIKKGFSIIGEEVRNLGGI